ncbi:gamma-secretase-activating protein isoform X6 [Manis javanica]|uniref:gamma-secretase-activating protein isoform X6 n=1 Tax=Manis javanica TaxID=9974 RepID=UPI003C6D7429
MALRLVAEFDLRKDVLAWLRAQRAAAAGAGARGGGPGAGGARRGAGPAGRRAGSPRVPRGSAAGRAARGNHPTYGSRPTPVPSREGVLENNYESLRVLNVERNGNIIYTYKDDKGNVFFGLYDCQTRQNEHLYTFEKDLKVVSCSVNSERTLLAASLVQSTKEGRKNEFEPGSKCLTLLVEIHPINNVKVLKAVDGYIWVQFTYPHVKSHPLPENHLLLISEEKYIEQFRIQLIQEEGNRVVIKHSGHLPRERIAEDFVWAQWDMSEQRLYYVDPKKSMSILKCIQFYADGKFNLMFEAPLDISVSDSEFNLVNFGCDDLQDQEKLSEHLKLHVFTNHTGSLCLCYSPKFDSWEEITYSVFYFHKGQSKTFTVALEHVGSHVRKGITFLNFDYYVAVYLPGHFFHLLNIQHPDLICHSLFLTGNNEVIDMLPHSPLQPMSGSLVLDQCSGRLYRALLNQSYLLQSLWNTQLDCEKMAVLHCLLSCGQDPRFQEAKIIQWISENISACHSFDLIQEFLIAASYWSIYPETSNMDKLLPYSSVSSWETEIPGISLVTEEIALPLMKVHSFKGYWEKLYANLEYAKYSKPHLHYHNSMVRREWHSLISEEKTGKRRSMVFVRNILDNAIKVISNLEARNLEPRLIPLLQEDDKHQRLLMGLMVFELKDHLLRHLLGVEKKKIEQMVLHYISKLLDLTCQILEANWRKHDLHPLVLHFNRRASAAELAVFHIMTRILEATSSLFLPLPPDLDNTEKNEKLKFSIIVRLPPLFGQKICRLWDHPMSSNIISRNHVKLLLQNYKRQPQSSMINKSASSVEFLPLNYFIEILTDIESSNQALYAFEGQDNVDAKFVEEAALKHTTMLLGL